MKLASLLLLFMTAHAIHATQMITLPGKSPIVTFRVVFRTGAASDPAGKEGVAALAAAMLAQGGSREMTYQQITEAFFPMAAGVRSQTDKEMTSFVAETHIDNLDAFYRIFSGMLLDPGWREDDFRRLKDDAINFLRVGLRGNNDEELGKEVLYNVIYAGHPYGHQNHGTVAALEKLTLDDLRQFYREHLTQANLIIGLAGGYPAAFAERMKKDFEKLPKGSETPLKLPEPKPIKGRHVTMIEKQTRSVAISMGFPIDVRRGDPDYPALLLMQSWLGPHRTSGGELYQRMRELRGLNYGDYAYIEYFPAGMFRFEPEPNLARHQQIFQIWIRPLQPPTAHFGLRLALFEFQKMIDKGLSEEDFERTRGFMSKYVNLLTKTKRAELGYAIDSSVYGIPDYLTYVKTGLAKLTKDDVNRAIKRHMQSENMDIVIVASGCEELRRKLLSDEPSPMKYNAAKPDDVLAEDKIVEKLPLHLKAEAVKIVKVESVFEH